ncbi:8-amino-7-oxononanoate synthase [Alkalilimnicola ehrlichii MLHE-1]|uniref:8-amino-7-oxononanoate synthase n=1 Tax=Alkalilimnicola ehrlichii (strain ATCC BAA-1101 / DSM 17681 / MLHE-1) TaxID=187272 RepID=BIOF_ALKEH|nr:8-amino-7-oxononanoate synthase [Alkalilimnicola ehrlichii]Q0A5W2.1 RecName: Full=8-amino-7-oxononanoate synthase; Short=AONS; AltName: Full=7-keto-8-amino-pelargonic acid synthase; Short=7-KAP synthase; Short=KAPA synthase; AltName: Full=8-amino-7-ketopelargonate synthase [Alkalilimnicola ehrlichii MLHE-1]ABI57775.1 8-amino-7-oxononanoate synthase [Alkalilimnicola ehrlichii MLHE-1]
MNAGALSRMLSEGLAARRAEGLYRSPRVLKSVDGACGLTADGRTVVVFCANDYLGLASDPRPGRVMARVAEEQGAGSGAAHLVSGHRPEHEALERALADWTGREAALLFSTGYMANLGVIDALVGRGDTVFEDRLNHASLLDGARLSGARLRRYRHGDVDHLARRLAEDGGRHRLIVTDGVFSMDGDRAPVAELARLARDHGAWLMVDDAHGLGVLGEKGGGLLEQSGLDQDDVPVLVGTLGKAVGSFGAFVAGRRLLIDHLVQSARTWIYTTAPSPAQTAATVEAVRLARHETWRREHLRALVRRFRAGIADLGLDLMPSETPIQPIVVGEADQALQASRALEERGYLVTAIRPPTVPKGTARLRVTLSAAHTPQQVDGLVAALGQVLGQ